MISITSTLSLFVIALVSTCFTLPIVDQRVETVTLSPFNNDLTTDKILSLRLVSDSETIGMPSMPFEQTTESLPRPKKQTTDEHMNFEMSTSADHLLPAGASRVSRMFDELATMESFTFPPTTERSIHDKRGSDDLTMTTVESITQGFEAMPRELMMETTMGTESEPIKRSFEDDLMTTSEPDTEYTTFKPIPSDTEHEQKVNERDIPMEFTTSSMPSFTSTSSVVAPRFYTSESSTSTSTSTTSTSTTTTFPSTTTTFSSTTTKKYTGLLDDESAHENDEVEHEHEHEHEHEETDSVKESSSSTTESKVVSDEESKDAHIPTAVFDQGALKNVVNVPNDVMYLDDKSDVITLPSKLFPVTMDNQVEQNQLPQVEKPLHTSEKKSDN